MQSGDRDEFRKTLKVLCAARGVPWTEERDEAFWKGLAKMSLIQFNRAVDMMCATEDPPRNLTPGQVWQAYKAQRSTALTLTPSPTLPEDKWGKEANLRLLEHITTRVAHDPRRYGEPSTWSVMKSTTDANADAAPIFVQNVWTLVDAKNRWAELMRASDEGDGVATDEQTQCWHACLQQAERDIDARMTSEQRLIAA